MEHHHGVWCLNHRDAGRIIRRKVAATPENAEIFAPQVSLEDRALLSADVGPSEPIVVHGTHEHDRIILIRLDEDRVVVKVESCLDPEWTRSTVNLVISYEAPAGCIVGVNGDGGHDVVEFADSVYGHILLSEASIHNSPTHSVGIQGPDGWIIWAEEVQPCFAELDASDAAPASFTDGVEMEDGTEINKGLNVRCCIDDPVCLLPIEDDHPVFPEDLIPENGVDVEADDASIDSEGPVANFPCLGDAAFPTEEDEGTWPAIYFDPESEGTAGADGLLDDGDLADLWADGLPTDEYDLWTADGDDGSDWPSDDEWIVTDLDS